jgi:uncharacterized protein
MQYEVSWVNSLAEVSPQEWDEMAVKLKTPFFQWAWLRNMETSGSTTNRTGWLPNHLLVRNPAGRLVAAAPMYVKGHSYGEFVFDNQWAEVSERLGREYYPKLLGMSPFTPAEGYRFLIQDSENEAVMTELMIKMIDQFCVRNQLSGCNFLYVDPTWRSQLESLGFSIWQHHGYIWSNQNYKNFDDYLKSFNANQRRNIKRERKSVAQAGLSFKVWTGDAIPAHLFKLMYTFYADTCDKFGWWGSKYLTQAFFEKLESIWRDKVVFFAAYDEIDDHNPVGMSFCLRDDDRLYGRYWGSSVEVDALHFEACYYQPIEWAIQNGIRIFDPGAGGRHKKRRGFPAVVNYSIHRFYDPQMAHLLRTNIDRINIMEQREVDAINEDLPFTPAPQQLFGSEGTVQ